MVEDFDEDHSSQVRAALVKGVLVIVAIGAVIALGTAVLVHALGLKDPSDSGPVGSTSASPQPPSPLPSTALPTTESPSPSPSASPSPSPSVTVSPGAPGLVLRVSPVVVKKSERINLTGTYRGADNTQLFIQRLQGTVWRSVAVTSPIHLGTFTGHVSTQVAGSTRFRVYDPVAKKASNEVRVVIR